MTTPYDNKILLVNFRGFTTPGRTPTETAQIIRQKTPNVAGVMIKTSNGAVWQGEIAGDNDPKAITSQRAIRQWVDELAPHNLEVHAWGVPRAKRKPGQTQAADLPGEADHLVKSVQPGVRSLVLDVEHGDYYWLGTPDEARRLMDMVRAGLPAGTHIGLCIDGRRNRDFRWWVDPWIPYVDSIHPMIYPIMFGRYKSVEEHIEESLNNLRGYGKPLVPMLQAFGEAGARPTQEEVTRQGSAAFARGAVGVTFFRLGCDLWSGDGKPHMGEPEYAGIAAIPLPKPIDVDQPTYSWQDVINAVVAAATRTENRWQDWLDRAGFMSVFANNLRSQRYSGPPVEAWALPPEARTEILDLLKLDSDTLARLTADIQSEAERIAKERDAAERLARGSIIGIHGAPGAAAPPEAMWDTWIKMLKDMQISWFKQVDWGDRPDDHIFRWAKRLKAEGIEPIIRYYVGGMFPDSLPPIAFDKMRAYAAAGITWAEIGNEPNLTVEWKGEWQANFSVMNPALVRAVAAAWVKDAQKALDAGAKPAFYATAPTDWRGQSNPWFSGVLLTRGVVSELAQNYRQQTLDIFARGGWIAVHSATFEQPVDFDPFPAGAPEWDMTLRSYEITLREFKRAFGAALDVDAIPVISTEGGVYTKDSSSMFGHERLASHEEHARRVTDMFRYLDRARRLKAMCPWCISVGSLIGHYDAQFAEDGWIREVNGQLAPLPVYEAMRQLRFDQNQEETIVQEGSGKIMLDVAYHSQNDPNTARTHLADCGPTCLTMIFNTGKSPAERVSVDALYQISPTLRGKSATDFTTLAEMAAIARENGVALRGETLDSAAALDALRRHVREGVLTIALVNYARWIDIAKPGFVYRDSHFVVVTGCDEGGIFVHDPIFSPADGRGRHFVWTNEKFLSAWGSLHELPNRGPDFYLMVSDKRAAALP
ncbi:MAG: C39 family peptidase [Anaerolineae bacterium]|nr:C39 family peptidase [Anaerolineae bacterium]